MNEQLETIALNIYNNYLTEAILIFIIIFLIYFCFFKKKKYSIEKIKKIIIDANSEIMEAYQHLGKGNKKLDELYEIMKSVEKGKKEEE